MLTNIALLALAGSAAASPLVKRGAAIPVAGNFTGAVYPPTSIQNSATALFPAETVIGYPGVSPRPLSTRQPSAVRSELSP